MSTSRQIRRSAGFEYSQVLALTFQQEHHKLWRLQNKAQESSTVRNPTLYVQTKEAWSIQLTQSVSTCLRVTTASSIKQKF